MTGKDGSEVLMGMEKVGKRWEEGGIRGDQWKASNSKTCLVQQILAPLCTAYKNVRTVLQHNVYFCFTQTHVHIIAEALRVL